jgi:hypothetical protein
MDAFAFQLFGLFVRIEQVKHRALIMLKEISEP